MIDFDHAERGTQSGSEALWYPLFPVATLWFTSTVPSLYLAGVVACLVEGRSDSFVVKTSQARI